MINRVIDISHHNERINFEKVKEAGIIGVIHKATQGISFVDDKYRERKKEALENGLLWGAYHFGTDKNGKNQADHFLNHIDNNNDTIIALDFERNDPKPYDTIHKKQGEDFIEAIHERFNLYPGIYSGTFLHSQITNNSIFKKCWLWLIDWDNNPNWPKNIWDKWTLWQYTGDGNGPEPHKVDGISGNCDRDKFNGEEYALKEFWESNKI
ncbi:MAG: glycoside hydrolase family 25 protein [Ignavibacteriae bacterium]|nr:glycoside hydrolase family 25 protein [Ignavibacteriota bacterium]MCB9242950.1 glycoside hydrolase family 25 protein [Ignavibacteriales bacterium]